AIQYDDSNARKQPMTSTGSQNEARTAHSDARSQVDLAVSGMTCASCASRIERKLNKIDGVEATVNYATEKAHVRYADAVSTRDLVSTVEKAGYGATLPEPADGRS